MLLKNLQLENWNQFEKIDIDLHPRLTILTGSNGAGKSTILRMLSKMVGNEDSELAVPLHRNGYSRYYPNVHSNPSQQRHEKKMHIGKMTQANGSLLDIWVPHQSVSAEFSILLSPARSRSIRGFLIPSHIPPHSYQRVEYVSTRPNIKESLNVGAMGRHQIKESLVSLAVFGKGNEFVEQDKEALQLFLGFTDVLKMLLPPTLGFQSLIVRDGEVLFKTASGEFLLDAVSGGIGAIIELAWRIYMFGAGETRPYLVLIDEAENHLHASMQRELLPKLLQAFSQAQFVISTHSPLMVNSVRDASVYALIYNEKHLVESRKLVLTNTAANVSQILRDVLGVAVTMPAWAEDALNNVLETFMNKELTAQSYSCMKEQLSELGLSEYLPQVLQHFQEGDSS